MSFRPVSTLETALPENVAFSHDWELFLEQITEYYNDTNRKVNYKDRGYYLDTEILNDQRWFNVADVRNFHQIYRKVVSTGTLPNAATTTTAHGIANITNAWMFTRIYGTAINPAVPRWIPIPNDGATYPCGVWVDNTNVYIQSAVNLAAFTTSYVVLEYWKS